MSQGGDTTWGAGLEMGIGAWAWGDRWFWQYGSGHSEAGSRCHQPAYQKKENQPLLFPALPSDPHARIVAFTSDLGNPGAARGWARPYLPSRPSRRACCATVPVCHCARGCPPL